MATEPLVPSIASAPVNLQLTQAEEKTIITDPQEWADDYALKVAVRDFEKWEQYRAYNHDRRFREAERLLTGWVEKKFWEGTKVQRSAVPVFIALQEIEVLQSRLIDQIFSDEPPFAVSPEPGTTIAQAFAVRDLLSSQFRNIGKPDTFITGREIFRRANKSALTYGAGIIEMGWLMREINRTVYDRRAIAETTTVQHPQLGPIQAPTGNLKMVATTRQIKRLESRPMAQNIDIRDFYWDPDCTGPNPQEAKGTATRHLLTIEQVKGMATNPASGFRLPTDADLKELAAQKFSTQGDFSKQAAEAYRGNSYQPQLDTSVDPALHKIELIRYWRGNRHVEVLGRKHVFFNECNQYEIIPHLNVFYIDMLGRFLGFSIPDLVEGDHKLAMTILNDRIDELNILLHPPIIRRRGAMMGTSGKRFHPGASWEVSGEPESDVIRMEMGTVNPQAFAEINALELRVQKLTGNTDVAAYGVASSGGDSSSRTATGIGAKQASGNARLGYQVGNLEDQVLEPFLYILLKLNKIYLDPSQLINILGPDAQQIQLDPLDVLNADVRFKVLASQKMRTKQALQAGGINEILTTYLNPATIEQWKQMGVTPDMTNIDSLVSDALNLPKMTLIRPMNPQEMQMHQQQMAMPLMAKQQLQDSRMQGQAQMASDKDETALLKTFITKLFTPEAAHALFGGIFGMEPPAVTDAKAQQYAPKQLPAGQ